ncbi:MAG: DNA primase [Deltaproteobacteria bacterium]|nr:DNA primase [Deltaproteobacteria bacterium]
MENLAYESVIKEIKRRLSIVNLIENYLSLRRSGKSYVGLCPFHDDKNPSLHVNEEKGVFHCFACGAGGDIFGFIMRYNNLTFSESVKELARRADVKLEKSSISVKNRSKRDILFKTNSLVCSFYHEFLRRSKRSKEVIDYLAGRGISLEIIKEFQLGYAPDEWDTLVQFLTAKNIPLSVAERLGLVIKRNNKDGYYDRFRKRIMFPIKDIDGKVVGFGGRTLDGDEPKYMNSPESEIYHKKSVLFGLDKSRDFIRKFDKALVVEGYMDFLSLYFTGIKNAVATLGTSLTRDHAMLLKRYTDKVVVVFDGDEAGIKASLRVLQVFLEEGVSPLMVVLPKGDDPSSFISAGRQDEFQRLVEGAAPLLDIFIEKNIRDFQEGKITRSRAVQEVADVLKKIKDSIEKSHYIKKTGESFGVRENELLSLMKYSEKLEKERFKTKKAADTQERLILKIVLKFPEYLNYLREENLIDFISENDIKTVLKELILNGFDDVPSLLIRFSSGSVQEIISETVFFSDDVPDEATAWKMLRDCIRTLKLRRLEDSLRLLRLKIDQALAMKNFILEKELIKEYRDLVEQEKSIKGGSS